VISVADAIALVKFTSEEERALNKLEGRIDAELCSAKFEGVPLSLAFPTDDISPKIMAAIQRRYEMACWRVVVDYKARSFLFVPMFLPMAPGKLVDSKRALPPVVTQQIVVAAPAHKLLVRMPTRGRPLQAIETLTKYRAMAGMPVEIEVVIDSDDETMVRAEVLQRLRALGCVITVGEHRSKVEAVNAGRVKDWDVLLLASDDQVPVAEGYAKRAMDAMLEHFPMLDGCVYFNDGYQGERIVTLPIIGRRLYAQFGSVYDSAYKSLWCDQEQTDVYSAMRRLAYVPEVIIEHQHHVTGMTKLDQLYIRNDALWDEDKATYERRRARQFDWTPPRLSVLICSLPSRRALLDKLTDELWMQADCSLMVEILVDAAEGGTIGEKRQRLLERARGEFIVFVDDDDWVSHDYVHRILMAILDNPDADCIALNGVMVTSGVSPEPFYNSLEHAEWYSKDGKHYRSPSHLSPVRRELALAAGFPSKSYGEDHEYAMRLRPLLKKEASIGDAPAYFYFYQPRSEKKQEG
jgi:hypothetical protein